MSGPASADGLDAGGPIGEPSGPAPGTIGAVGTTLRVRPFRPGQPFETPAPPADPTGGAEPARWLGAEPVGGLMLPSAMPTASQLYAPRGVWIDGDRLIAADTGNHRVLIWPGRPDGASADDSHAEAAVVLGQPDATTEGAQAGGRGPERGMRLPTGLLVTDDGRLVVADAWNHRILIWDEVPTAGDVAPDVILGQSDPTGTDENRGGDCGPLTFYWPFGLATADGVFYVADTGNRRVLGWNGLPDPDRQPDLVLGQPAADAREENRGQLGPDSFRWPHDVAGLPPAPGRPGIVHVADAGNHRLLGWRPRPELDRPADTVLGQPDFTTGTEFPYVPQTATGFRFPYAVDIEAGGSDVGDNGAGGRMAVADTANNRILVWDSVPSASGVAAGRVLGQPDFAANGENRWDAVAADTLCWPYGLSLHRGVLAVADSGNNRIVVWRLDPEPAP